MKPQFSLHRTQPTTNIAPTYLVNQYL